MPNENVQTGKNDGENPTIPTTDMYAEMRGKKDTNDVPLHPEERAEYYKVKFAESTRGVEALVASEKKLKEENETLKTKKEQNTEDELSKTIPDWDILTLDQRRSISMSVGSLKQDLEKVKAQVAEIVDEREFEHTFKKVTSEPEFAIIKRHKREFREYAYKQENLNVPLSILSKSFLVDKNLIGVKPTEQNKDDNPDAGRSGLDSGSGGDRTPQTPKGGYTADEVEKIRKEDPRKYARLAREGKLNIKE